MPERFDDADEVVARPPRRPLAPFLVVDVTAVAAGDLGGTTTPSRDTVAPLLASRSAMSCWVVLTLVSRGEVMDVTCTARRTLSKAELPLGIEVSQEAAVVAAAAAVAGWTPFGVVQLDGAAFLWPSRSADFLSLLLATLFFATGSREVGGLLGYG